MSNSKYLTKSQKDAIIRKIQNIQTEKIARITDDVRKSYKPSADEQAILNDVKEMNKLFQKMEQIAKKYENVNGLNVYNRYSHYPIPVETVRDNFICNIVNEKSKEINKTSIDDIYMELELSEVKGFNIDEFIKKFV